MKTNIALFIAIGMGLVGGMLNLLYLNGKSKDMESVSFLAIKPKLSIRKGETFRKDHFVEVDIPGKAAGEYMQNFAVPWTSLDTVDGMKAIRDYGGSEFGEIVLLQDLKTPPTELSLLSGEQLMWIPVDTRAAVTRNINPGNWVSFIVPIGSVPPAKPLKPVNPDDPDATDDGGLAVMPQTPQKFKTIGQFRVVSVGTRTCSQEVAKAYNISQQQENVLGIAVRADERGVVDRDALALWELVQQNSLRQAGVILHNPSQKSNSSLGKSGVP